MANWDAATRTAIAAATVGQIDAGSGAGKLRIYTGSRPAGPATAASGTLLAEFTLSDPAFTTSAGVATLDITPAVQDASADNTGTAGYARFLDSDGNGRIDATVTATGGGGEVTCNTTAFVTGAVVTVTGCTITAPAGV
ncbi:MAG: hypothetical protein V4515_14395 [Chloroflexota bacterium]